MIAIELSSTCQVSRALSPSQVSSSCDLRYIAHTRTSTSRLHIITSKMSNRTTGHLATSEPNDEEVEKTIDVIWDDDKIVKVCLQYLTLLYT